MTDEPKKKRMPMLMRRDLWLRDEGLTVLLGALLLMIFIVNPLAAANVLGGHAALCGSSQIFSRTPSTKI